MEKIVIFVSYNHEADARWFNKKYFDERPLIPWLQHMLRNQNVEFWYDREGLGAGDKFRAEIEKQIDRADIALLLVSRGFMLADFINTVELPRIEARARRDELVVMPIITRRCPWQRLNLLDSVIIMPSSTTPLIDYTKNEVDFINAREELIEGIERQIQKLREKEEKPRILRGRIATASYHEDVSDVDVQIAPLGLAAHTDEDGRFEVDLTEVATAEIGETITFEVTGYKPATAQLQLDEELPLSVTPENWPECPSCGHANRPENFHCWECGHKLREEEPPASPDVADTPIACLECDARYDADDCPNFCYQCGHRLKEEQAASLPPSA